MFSRFEKVCRIVGTLTLAATTALLAGCLEINTPPSAHFVVQTRYYLESGRILLDASLSYDLDDDSLVYEWFVWNVTDPCNRFLAAHARCESPFAWWQPFAEYDGCCSVISLSVHGRHGPTAAAVGVDGIVPEPVGRVARYEIVLRVCDGKDDREACKAVDAVEGYCVCEAG